MLAHNVIILTAGRANEIRRGRLDQLVDFVLSMKKTPIIVVGPDGDDLLRTTARLDDCEIVFDPNFNGEEFSSVKAGLQSTGEPCFFLRANSPLPSRETFQQLERELMGSQTSGVDVYATPNHDDPNAVFLVTQRGVRSLKNQPASTRWLKSQEIAFRLVQAPEVLKPTA
jgi:hypothetical protein